MEMNRLGCLPSSLPPQIRIIFFLGPALPLSASLHLALTLRSRGWMEEGPLSASSVGKHQ